MEQKTDLQERNDLKIDEYYELVVQEGSHPFFDRRSFLAANAFKQGELKHAIRRCIHCSCVRPSWSQTELPFESLSKALKVPKSERQDFKRVGDLPNSARLPGDEYVCKACVKFATEERERGM